MASSKRLALSVGHHLAGVAFKGSIGQGSFVSKALLEIIVAFQSSHFWPWDGRSGSSEWWDGSGTIMLESWSYWMSSRKRTSHIKQTGRFVIGKGGNQLVIARSTHLRLQSWNCCRGSGCGDLFILITLCIVRELIDVPIVLFPVFEEEGNWKGQKHESQRDEDHLFGSNLCSWSSNHKVGSTWITIDIRWLKITLIYRSSDGGSGDLICRNILSLFINVRGAFEFVAWGFHINVGLDGRYWCRLLCGSFREQMELGKILQRMDFPMTWIAPGSNKSILTSDAYWEQLSQLLHLSPLDSLFSNWHSFWVDSASHCLKFLLSSRRSSKTSAVFHVRKKETEAPNTTLYIEFLLSFYCGLIARNSIKKTA